jgi:hypothetical protein
MSDTVDVIMGPALVGEKAFSPLLCTPAIITGPGKREHENGNWDQVGSLLGGIYRGRLHDNGLDGGLSQEDQTPHDRYHPEYPAELGPGSRGDRDISPPGGAGCLEDANPAGSPRLSKLL